MDKVLETFFKFIGYEDTLGTLFIVQHADLFLVSSTIAFLSGCFVGIAYTSNSASASTCQTVSIASVSTLEPNPTSSSDVDAKASSEVAAAACDPPVDKASPSPLRSPWWRWDKKSGGGGPMTPTASAFPKVKPFHVEEVLTEGGQRDLDDKESSHVAVADPQHPQAPVSSSQPPAEEEEVEDSSFVPSILSPKLGVEDTTKEDDGKELEPEQEKHPDRQSSEPVVNEETGEDGRPKEGNEGADETPSPLSSDQSPAAATKREKEEDDCSKAEEDGGENPYRTTVSELLADDRRKIKHWLRRMKRNERELL